ncbi:hypothetical protein C8R43DRAFT_1114094 [Mycena crocata]|nr:hypothetical protein C8R43DRAFT_1114094 [Mycena crocata]
MASNVDMKDLTVEIKAKNHREHPTVIQTISVKHVARVLSMDEDMDEMHQFSVTFFDKYGHHRGQEVGTWTLQQFLGSEYVQTGDTVICWLTSVGMRDKDVWKATRNRQIGFFRKARNNFRRIGRTGFFGYSPKQDHPSRSISSDADVGALDDNFSNPTATTFEERQQSSGTWDMKLELERRNNYWDRNMFQPSLRHVLADCGHTRQRGLEC